MSVIEAAHYGETRNRLINDPIILKMAHELVSHDRAELAHESGTPRHDFMGAANDTYRERGGQDGGHMGAVAEALLLVLDEPKIRISFETEAGQIEALTEHHRYEARPGNHLERGGKRWKLLTSPVEHPGVVEARKFGIDLGDGPQLHLVRIREV